MGEQEQKSRLGLRREIRAIIREAIEDNEESTLNKLIEARIQSAIKPYKWLFWGFVSGVTLFVSAGVISQGALFEAIVRSMYPPTSIAKDTKDILANDSEFREAVFRKTDFGSLTIADASFDTFPAIADAMPATVWEHVVNGDRANYIKLVQKPEFFQALRKYHADTTRRFLLPSLSNAERAAEIEEVGQVPIDVQILMAGSQADNTTTASCRRTFRDTELHAELVIPKSYKDEELAWFNCTFGWPQTFLEVSVSDTKASGVKLVGVRRNGKTKRPILLVSQRTASALALPGWQSYSSNINGQMKVHRAE